jgi:hypothetical protein
MVVPVALNGKSRTNLFQRAPSDSRTRRHHAENVARMPPSLATVAVARQARPIARQRPETTRKPAKRRGHRSDGGEWDT